MKNVASIKKQSNEQFFKNQTLFFMLVLITIILSFACGSTSDSPATGAQPDTTAPTVSSTSPTNSAVDIATNTAITAVFSENMNVSTITTSTFTVAIGGNNISGAVTYSGTTATFIPASAFAYNTQYTAVITTGVKDSAGNAMANNYTWSFTTGAQPDTTAPTVTSTSPTNSAVDVATNTAITAVFSENMNVSTITTSTFTVATGGNNISGAVTYSGTKATFTPVSVLAYNTQYTAIITTGVKDSAGNAMANNYTWSFTTGVQSDTTPPMVSSASPINYATDVAVNTAITAVFSENMNTSTITTSTFTVATGGNNISGAVTYSGTTATFTPASVLAYNTQYMAIITTGVNDSAGNAMANNYTWSFTTGVQSDTTAPIVSSTSPTNSAVDVATNTAITAVFSENMNVSTITTSTFTVAIGGNNISGAVTYSGTTATFTPASTLAYNMQYTAIITTGVKDSAGNAMANNYTWSFTTGSNSIADTTTITNSIGMKLVYIQPGTFQMGSPDSETDRYSDETQHKVTLTNGFYLQTTELTQGQWKAVMGNDNNPSYFKGDNLPVERVSWDDCQEFIVKLNTLTGKNYRLPTEAEWEYACRAGTTTAFHYGNSLSSDMANFNGNYPYNSSTGVYREKTTDVGSFEPNAFGLYDMHGNVWEWCSDWYGTYASGDQTNPVGPSTGSNRVSRGGSWYYSARYCRSALRIDYDPSYGYYSIGFRLALPTGQ